MNTTLEFFPFYAVFHKIFIFLIILLKNKLCILFNSKIVSEEIKFILVHTIIILVLFIIEKKG